jgi:toxin ParE1/3/4
MGITRPELAPEEVRFLVLAEFQFVIVYRATTRPPRILRVLHGARDLPGTLRDIFGDR